MAEAINVGVATNRHVDERYLFRVAFHFLVAKILHDRSNPVSTTWDPDKIETVLHAISRYYQLEPLPVQHGSLSYRAFEAVWECLRRGINFQNISADDLAF